MQKEPFFQTTQTLNIKTDQYTYQTDPPSPHKHKKRQKDLKTPPLRNFEKTQNITLPAVLGRMLPFDI